MSNEELLKMYEAIKADPGELVRAAARKRLINFARYMQPDLVLVSIHASVKDATIQHLDFIHVLQIGFNPRICKRCDQY